MSLSIMGGTSEPLDRSPQLQALMQQAGFSSFRSLAQAAAVSETQIRKLRQGKLSQMRLVTLQQLSQALKLSLTELLNACSDSSASITTSDLQQEYDRLQAQLVQQRAELWQEFQQDSLQILESLLLQLPTAAHAAQQNPQLAALKLLPLLRPLDRLLETWDVAAIAPVGAEVAYDPQQHQLMSGTAQPGDPVRVRYTGYRQGDRWLHRAKVSPSEAFLDRATAPD